MLHFCNTNIYLDLELSNDTAEEVWTTSCPACVNIDDAQGIYEGVNIHLFKADNLRSNKIFLKDKKNVMLNYLELYDFVHSWYYDCVTRKTISDCVNISEWYNFYEQCYIDTYKNTNVYEGVLGYYESLALARLMFPRVFREPYDIDLRSYNCAPEFSWILADYFNNGKKSVWKNCINKIIQENIKSMLYQKANYERFGVPVINLSIDLSLTKTIDEIDFDNPQALFYFSNPFNPDFHTNFIYIRNLLKLIK